MLNKVILIGNAGADPEVRSLESGVKMARLKVATTERIYNSATGEKREHTEWHSITLWRVQADFVEKYIRKGTQVYIEGKIRTRELTDDATGAKRTVVEIHGEEIKALGRRSDNGIGAGQAPVARNTAAEVSAPANNDAVMQNSPSERIEALKAKIPMMPEPDDLPF